jgi:hypothetical protein
MAKTSARMWRTAIPLAGLVAQVGQGGAPDPLASALAAWSGLPGPRGNLELAQAFADLAATAPAGNRDRLRALCGRWLAEAGPDAAENTPGAFLAFCGVVGIGALGATASARAEVTASLAALRAAAGDPRWRVREGVAMGLQRLLGAKRDVTLGHLTRWVARGDWLVPRAVVAAVADPPLLRDPLLARAAIEVHRRVIRRVRAARARRVEAFRVLRQALGYTISVVAAARPREGIRLLRQMAASGDPDLVWIVRENLKKRRLMLAAPEDAARLQKMLHASLQNRRPSATS